MDPLIHEYNKNAIPEMTEVCPAIFPPEIYKNCECTKVFELDQKSTLQSSFPCTSPNLLANFVKITPGDDLVLVANCTSHLFYVISGNGVYCSSDLCSLWSEGDLFVLSGQDSIHLTSRSSKDSVLYWINDSPLLEFLGVKFAKAKFTPTLFKKDLLLKNLEQVRHDVNNHDKNRLGILLSNADTENSTKTITHVLWSLLNVLPAQTKQPPHKHNSVALDLCVSGGSNQVYTLMGPELDELGWVKNPLRIDWETGGAFVTPPGWYHSHHNDSDVDALVLPIQDAGLYTYQRTLNLTFSNP